MNILYCGDRHIEDGLIISVLSLLKNVKEPLHIYVLTMSLTVGERQFLPVSMGTAAYLDQKVRANSADGFVRLIDLSDQFAALLPKSNLNTRFTPYCMLRLFADAAADLPERMLYLDNDVVCRKDCAAFYHQPMEAYELAGVLDHYGKWFFRRKPLRFDYINSGVLLLNLKKIKETGLFARCRTMCAEKEMFMPDQSAINKLSAYKKICPRRFNEQRRLQKDTVFQHFTTSFRFFPWVHTLTVKPWETERVHEKLKIFEYDDILDEYKKIAAELKGC